MVVQAARWDLFVTERRTYSEENPGDALADDLTPEQIDDLVLYEQVDGHIAVITLNRPERRNAFLAPHSFLELRRKVERAENDDDIKVIVLTATRSEEHTSELQSLRHLVCR